MQFNSIEFLFYFLPLFLAVYYAAPIKLRSPVMVLGSLCFYGFASGGNLWWIGLLVVLTFVGYLAGRMLGKFPKKWLLGFFLTVLLAVLSFFKLYNGGRHLPAGMSFYLFQIAAYLIDITRRKILPEKKLWMYFAQVTMFPKLLSGPLMDPQQLRLQQRYCRPNGFDFLEGLKILICGLGLKVCIANRLGSLWAQSAVVGYESISAGFAWLSLVGYAMQLFYDFYGYSLMARGIGKMLGYDLPENFLDPYASRTVSEFYRRWHASLGAWFKNYLYIPLGGSRKGTFRTILNLGFVWLFTGLWHGIGGSYLIWAGFLFLLIVNERLWLGKFLKKSHIISHVYVVFVILLSWVPFAVGDFSQMTVFLGRLFGQCGTALNAMDYWIFGKDYLGILACGVLFATPIPRKIWNRWKTSPVMDILLLGIFWLVVFYISTSAQDPFMYFAY